MSVLKALVLCGEGINCETETAYALKTAGFQVKISTINALIAEGFSQEKLQKEFVLLALPGGFSYGDELGSGRVLAIKIKRALKLDLHQFTKQGGLVLGICNGFQALIRLGVFGSQVSITRNSTHQFMDRWVNLRKVGQNQSPWLNEIESADLPIRHGEGRIVFANSARVRDSASSHVNEFLPALAYSEDVNGSADRLAGLTAAEGRIFGLMPHPEAFVRWTQFPAWTSSPLRTGDRAREGAGLKFFNNAFTELKKGN